MKSPYTNTLYTSTLYLYILQLKSLHPSCHTFRLNSVLKHFSPVFFRNSTLLAFQNRALQSSIKCPIPFLWYALSYTPFYSVWELAYYHLFYIYIYTRANIYIQLIFSSLLNLPLIIPIIIYNTYRVPLYLEMVLKFALPPVLPVAVCIVFVIVLLIFPPRY